MLHELFGTDIRCCARNELGRECTRLFTIGNTIISRTFVFSDEFLATIRD